MTDDQKERWFRISFWSAAVLYAWGFVIMWIGPEWGLSGGTFYLVGVLPTVVAVFAMSTALGLYMDLRGKDE